MSVFVHLCEAFLGIEPHFDLFRHLFHLKPQPSSASLDVVGGAGVQLRQRMDRVYIPYKLSQKVIDWKPRWFYIENHGNSLPPILAGPPIQRAEWLKMPIDMSQIPELLEMIASLKQKGISGEAIAFDWMKHRIQPLQARVTFGFEYQGKMIRRDVREKRFPMEKLFVEYNNYSRRWNMFRTFSTHFQC